ncbi:MAG: alpha/beta fold hydrolase [bacterium]
MDIEKIKVNDRYIACSISSVEGKPAIVFIHGAGSTREVWEAQWIYFKDKTKVVIPDLPGHGDSDGKGCNSISDYADIIVDLVKGLKIEKCILTGHSMGGAIAQNIALRYAELLSRLILVATGARLRVTPQVFKAIETDYKNYISLASSFSMSASTDEQIKSRFQSILTHSSPQSAYDDFLACDRFDEMNRIDNIRTKTLIIVGDNDMMTPPKYAAFLHQKISGSELVNIKDAGHMVMMEKPHEVNMAIERFISTIL